MFKGGKIPDFEGYRSPIQQIADEICLEMENHVCTAVQKVGIYVDKEELIKALQYDRGQYDKGYADGYAAGYEKAKEDIKANFVNNISKLFGDEV